MKPYHLSAIAFVRIWNLAPDAKTAYRRLRMTPKSATLRAALYRTKYKIPLQRFGTKPPEVDWGAVRAAALKATARRLT